MTRDSFSLTREQVERIETWMAAMKENLSAEPDMG